MIRSVLHGAGLPLVALALFALALLASPAHAQPSPHSGDSAAPGRGVPDVPPGTARIRVSVVHADGPGRTGGLELALYALDPDGVPGIRNAATDADGVHVFEGVSNASDMVYLVGSRYADIPFGERVSFAIGQDEVEVVITVSDPVADASSVKVASTDIQIEWVGSTLAVQEIHALRNEGEGVVSLGPEQRPGRQPVLHTVLPAGATSFSPAAGSFTSGLEQRDAEILFWGPVYPGEQSVRYGYLMPLEGSSEGEELLIEGRLPSGAERLRLRVPESGPALQVDGFSEGEIEEVEGRSYRVFEAGPFEPGARYTARVSIPVSTGDASRISLPRSDLWVEMDGAALLVSQDFRLVVPDGARLLGSVSKPLLRFPLSEGAELLGISQNAASVGLGAGSHGGLDLVGPLPPGETRLGVRYRVPLDADSRLARLQIGFPADVDLLNVLVADTGIVVEDRVLHRRRPVRSGTRMYLHREGFQIAANEPFELSIRALDRAGLPTWAGMAMALAIALAGAAFVFAPLGGERGGQTAEDPAPTGRERERALLIDSIRDLDFDFETGKIAESDHREMRGSLRARAVELLREERAAAEAERHPAPSPGSKTDPAVSRAAFCPSCGARVTAGWRFCAGCGEGLEELAQVDEPAR